MLLIRYSGGMGKEKLVGPATQYIAGELRAQKARMGWSLDDIAARSDIARGTVDRALKGLSAIAIEIFIPLAEGMELDPISLLRDAGNAR